MDQDDLLEGIVDIGYPAIEIWGRDDGFDTLCEAAARYKLRVVSMTGHQALGDGLNKTENTPASKPS